MRSERGSVRGTWPTKKQAAWISVLAVALILAIAGAASYLAKSEVRFSCNVEDGCGEWTGGVLSGQVERRFVVRAFGLWIVDAGVGPRPIVSSTCTFEEAGR